MRYDITPAALDSMTAIMIAGQFTRGIHHPEALRYADEIIHRFGQAFEISLDIMFQARCLFRNRLPPAE
jgi:hypothetical protein